MSEKVHVLSNNGTFLFRFNNGEFGSKWCGLWRKNTKYFDYFAFKINGEFLSSSNSETFNFYDSQYATKTFSLPSGKVTEEIVCSDGFIVVTVKPSFDAKVEAEIGVNIRDGGEGYTQDKRYYLSGDGKKTVISYGGKSAYIIRETGEFSEQEKYSTHSPGTYARNAGFSKYFDDASVQNKYVPGIISSDVKAGGEFSIILSTKDLDNENAYKTFKNRLHQVKEYDSILGSIYSQMGTNSVFPEELLKSSIDALYSFANFPEREIYAGFPYFNKFWIRDSLVILPSFLSINSAAFVRGVLDRVSRMVGLQGLINFENGDIYSFDTPALFVIDVYEYYKWTGDSDFVKSVFNSIRRALKFGEENSQNGLIRDSGKTTWMDTQDRLYSIDIQALWCRAFDCGEELLRFGEGDASWTVSDMSGVLDGLKKYDRETYFADQLNSDLNSVNQIFMPFYGVSYGDSSKRIITNAEKSLLCEFGVTSVARSEKTFDPHGYHTGSVWPFTTAMLCGSAYANGFPELGEKCVSILSGNLDAQCSSRINEIYEPNGKPQGCPSQAWSIGLIPYVMDRFVLGIEVDVPMKRIRIRKPETSLEAERTLLINRKAIRLAFSDGKITSNMPVSEKEGFLEISLS